MLTGNRHLISGNAHVGHIYTYKTSLGVQSEHPPREFDDVCFKSSLWIRFLCNCIVITHRQLEDQGMVSRAAPFVTICLLLWIAHCQIGNNGCVV